MKNNRLSIECECLNDNCCKSYSIENIEILKSIQSGLLLVSNDCYLQFDFEDIEIFEQYKLVKEI